MVNLSLKESLESVKESLEERYYCSYLRRRFQLHLPNTLDFARIIHVLTVTSPGSQSNNSDL